MEDMTKLLTVSVAAYHVEKYLNQCLDSFVLPEYANELEVLVINDGSGEKINEIVREYEKKYPQIFRLIEKENGGHGSTINTGIREAKGRYFKIVDGDDYVCRESMYSLLESLGKIQADMFVTGYETFDDRTGNIKKQYKTCFRGQVFQKIYVFDEVASDIFINMHAVTFRTEILKEMGYLLDEHCFYVDAQYRLYPIPYVNTIVFLDIILYRYRLGQEKQSMAIRSMQKNCCQHEKVLERLLQFYHEKQNALSPEKRDYIQKGIAGFATSQIKIYLSYPYSPEHKAQICTLERKLKETAPLIYRKMKNPAISFLRKSKYKLYPMASRICRGIYRC